MAKVPYAPVPQEGISPQGIPEFSVPVPMEAFGANVAVALGGLGKEFEQAGDQLWARATALQQLENKAEVDEADAAYMIEAGKMQAEFNSLQGKAAVDAFPDYQKGLDTLRKTMTESLSNPTTRQAFNTQSLQTMGRTIFNGAGHAARQNKVYLAGASQARIDARFDYALQNPKDDIAFEQGLRLISHEVGTIQADIAGWSPEKTKEVIKDNQSKLISARVTGLARTDPFAAQQLLEKYRPMMDVASFERTEPKVQSAMRTQGARQIEADINADLHNDPLGSKMSLAERLKKAEARAKEIAPDDALFIDAVRSRVTAGFDQSRKAKRDADYQNEVTVSAAMFGTDGKVPTTVEELIADPYVRNSWEALPPGKQNSFRSALAKNAKGDVTMTDARFARTETLKGMAATDPEAFLGIDIMNEDIPRAQKAQLLDKQRQLTKTAESDPRVTKALQILGPTMYSAGITKAQDADGYFRFVGALQDQIVEYQQNVKKAPGFKEIQEMGTRLLQEKYDPSKWSFGILNRTTRVFEMEPADLEAIKKEPAWQELGIVPTDEQARRVFTARQYQKFYGKPKDQSRVPTPPTSK